MLGGVYIALGAVLVVGKRGVLRVSLGPSLAGRSGVRGPAALGILFGLNVPACAGSLLFAVLGTAAASGAGGVTLAAGFTSLALFGFALSLPLVLAVFFATVRRLSDDGLKAWQQVVEHGYEGLVAKDPESPYVGGRTLKWLKVKQRDYRVGERGWEPRG